MKRSALLLLAIALVLPLLAQTNKEIHCKRGTTCVVPLPRISSDVIAISATASADEARYEVAQAWSTLDSFGYWVAFDIPTESPAGHYTVHADCWTPYIDWAITAEQNFVVD